MLSNLKEESLKLHENGGKWEINSKVPLETKDDLSRAYTPGVAEVCKKVENNFEEAKKYTMIKNTVAVITDGSAVLGLGNIGTFGALPVMEGKAILFKKFGNIDAIPICIKTQDAKEIIEIIKQISDTFGGINLEDISAPRCFEIEEELKKSLKIPIFHDDQHGTAIVVLAGLINALKLTGRKKEDAKIVIAGAGAAGIAISKLLLEYGFKKITLCDSKGIISKNRKDLNWIKLEMSKVTNLENKEGGLKEALAGADIFIGVSGPNTVSEEMARSMNKRAIIFAMANPVPEIMPERAKSAGVEIIGTGRSDYPNQINNVLAFPGVFRGVFDANYSKITNSSKIAAANAISELVNENELKVEYIIPSPFDPRVAKTVAEAVKKQCEIEKNSN